jgi:hypothetical protein
MMHYNDSQLSRRCNAVKVWTAYKGYVGKEPVGDFLSKSFEGFEGFVTIIYIFWLKILGFFVILRPL